MSPKITTQRKGTNITYPQKCPDIFESMIFRTSPSVGYVFFGSREDDFSKKAPGGGTELGGCLFWVEVSKFDFGAGGSIFSGGPKRCLGGGFKDFFLMIQFD